MAEWTKKARRKLLVDTLLSGEIQQSRQFLHVINGMCCVGVACEVFRRYTGEGEWANYGSVEYAKKFVLRTEEKLYEAPDEVLEWYGITQEEQKAMIDMNDAKRRSFEFIAGYVDGL